MANFNRGLIEEQLARLTAGGGRGNSVPNGDYVARLVSVTQATNRFGRSWKLATFEILGGEHSGTRLRTPVWGNAERLVTDTQGAAGRFTLSVYTHRDADGGEYSRVNVEAIRRYEGVASGVDGEGGGDACASVPNRAEIVAASAKFEFGFRCVGRISAPRTIVPWAESFADMARNDAGVCSGQVVFLSAFQFTGAIADHQAANDRSDEASGKSPTSSLADYAGPCFAHYLTFDTDCRDADGEPDPASCLQAAQGLLARLIELDVAPELIDIFFSGSKGFHVAIPSSLAGARPGADFHLVTKEFCRLIADQAGISIDEKLYRALQPLRAPNSRHEKSGLFKIRLMAEELVTLPFEQMLDMARQPRAFEGPVVGCDPVPQLVALWRQAEHTVRSIAVAPAGRLRVEDGTARITRATWDYLLNAALVGERAESHFKAACNLADFGSIDELLHALMRRPAELSGLPNREAEAHVDSALKRAATRRHQ
jgi:hypothetical protein